MKTFSNLIDFVKDFETLYLKSTYTKIDGKYNLGYCNTVLNGKPVAEGMTCTPYQANSWISTRIASDKSKLSNMVKFQNIHQLDAIASFIYNQGLNGIPRTLSALKSGDFLKASKLLMLGIYIKDDPIKGLLLRRASEYDIFTKGIYTRRYEEDGIRPDQKAILLEMNGHNQAAVNMINQLRVK